LGDLSVKFRFSFTGGTMNLSFRPTQPKDLKECLPLAKDLSFFTKSEYPRLVALWTELLEGRMMQSAVVEDHERPAGQKVVAFGMHLYVTDDFAREIRTTLPPPATRRLFERRQKGRRVFLSHREVARQNAGDGLNLLITHYGWKALPAPEAVLLNATLIQSFFPLVLGFRIKEYFVETCDPTETEILMKNNSFNRIRRNYRQEAPAEGNPRSAGRMDVLIGTRREECDTAHGLYGFALLFHPKAPRFGFTQGEKDILEQALLSGTDEEIAKSLGISLWTVKKRWQWAYEKVERIDPRVLTTPASGDFPEENQKAKRRRYLLDYLRQHLEEIRPRLAAPKGRKPVHRPKK
jgi:DNA-binding CsgD family transcriptional regulator